MPYELDRNVNHPRLGLGRSVPRGTAEYEASGVVHPRLGFGRSVARETPLGEWEFGEVEIIPPTDDRVRLTSTVEVPFRFICCLDLFFPDPDNPSADLLFRGSGTLISPRHVLTCGHCLWDEITGTAGTTALREVRSVTVTPGRNGVDSSGSIRAPLGSTRSQSVKASPQWRASLDGDFDFGVITLVDAIGAQPKTALGNRPLGFWGSSADGAGTRITPVAPAALQGVPANVSGYPGDKCGTQPPVGSGTDAQIRACPTNTWASNQWRAYGKVLDAAPAATPRRIHYDMDTFGGHSGSPVWLRSGDTRNLIAVHHAGSGIGAFNEGVRVTAEMWNTVQSWIGGGGTTPVPPGSRPTVRRGSRGPAVIELQTRLNAWLRATPSSGLALLVIDGDFGARTDAAVRAFQRARGLTVDGIVGPNTWNALFAL